MCVCVLLCVCCVCAVCVCVCVFGDGVLGMGGRAHLDMRARWDWLTNVFCSCFHSSSCTISLAA